ncbi:MAG: NAD(P)/FAD-dependent oxidoreductase [Ideonella sp.]|nr:NAD(P)/FAD-dependent oxidoreductase [Ideonella sp.]MCC7458210.1 NAD(P)/FAD-dependent oxidoreductase [Nitrospira sp.]
MTGPLGMLIVGAGFGGLGAAAHRRRCGDDDFVLVEQADGVGGTWWANRYPGAACDIPSHLYSFSFAPNPRWTRHYPGQQEIAAYLDDCVHRFGLAPHLRLHTRLTHLLWDEAQHLWRARVRDAAGHEDELLAQAVTLATGPLSRPRMPALAGLERFCGLLLHTARWPDGFDASGRRIGVIGTGASAIQLVPQLAPLAQRLTVFQRSAPWILPRGDRPIGARTRWALAHVPGLRRLWRGALYCQHELRAPAFTRHPGWLRRLEPLALNHLRRRIPAGALRDALTPHYRMGCKRILLADDYYPALRRPNVALETRTIAAVEPQGVRLADGELVELDALVAATGFEAAEITPPCPVIGPQGRTLHATWARGPVGYLGTMVAGFPNLFTVIGPNTGLGHNSMVHVIESQLALIDDAMRALRAHAWLSPTADAQERFNAEIGARLARTVWATGGCTSWYQTRDGRITTLWPGSTLEFRRRTRRLDRPDFEFALR